MKLRHKKMARACYRTNWLGYGKGRYARDVTDDIRWSCWRWWRAFKGER